MYRIAEKEDKLNELQTSLPDPFGELLSTLLRFAANRVLTCHLQNSAFSAGVRIEYGALEKLKKRLVWDEKREREREG